MQKYTKYATYAKTYKNMQYMQNIPNMQNKQQHAKICNKYTKYAKSYHGATGSDTTSVAEHQASLFQECPLTPGSFLRVKLSCVLCMWTFTSFTSCVSILNMQYMQ